MDHMPTKVSQKWIENMVEKGPTGLAMLGQYTDCLQTQKKYTVSLSHAQEYENVAASWPELLTWLSFHEAHRPKALQEHIKFFLTANYKTDCTHVTEPEVFEAQELYPWKEEMQSFPTKQKVSRYDISVMRKSILKTHLFLRKKTILCGDSIDSIQAIHTMMTIEIHIKGQMC